MLKLDYTKPIKLKFMSELKVHNEESNSGLNLVDYEDSENEENQKSKTRRRTKKPIFNKDFNDFLKEKFPHKGKNGSYHLDPFDLKFAGRVKSIEEAREMSREALILKPMTEIQKARILKNKEFLKKLDARFKETNVSYNEKLRSSKAFNNPTILEKMILEGEIDQYGSNFSEEILAMWNLNDDDNYKNLREAQKRHKAIQDKKEQEKKMEKVELKKNDIKDR